MGRAGCGFAVLVVGAVLGAGAVPERYGTLGSRRLRAIWIDSDGPIDPQDSLDHIGRLKLEPRSTILTWFQDRSSWISMDTMDIRGHYLHGYPRISVDTNHKYRPLRFSMVIIHGDLLKPTIY